MMVHCYIAIVYGKTQGYMYRRYIVHSHTFIEFMPYNVTAHGLVLILLICYVAALITVLVLVQ